MTFNFVKAPLLAEVKLIRLVNLYDKYLIKLHRCMIYCIIIPLRKAITEILYLQRLSIPFNIANHKSLHWSQLRGCKMEFSSVFFVGCNPYLTSTSQPKMLKNYENFPN